jgi:PST family polysaccharide transporter
MTLRQKVAKGIVWSAAQTWGTHAITFLVTLILARLLPPEAFGLVAFASVFVAFAQIFEIRALAMRLCSVLLEQEHLDTAFWFNLLTGGLLTVVGIAASGLVAELFHEPQLAPIVAWLSLVFLSRPEQCPRGDSPAPVSLQAPGCARL